MGSSPILVTGSHRSGTTWVGKTLCTASRLHYVDEPFHPGHRLGNFPTRIDVWYRYVTEGSPDAGPLESALARTVALRYSPRAELSSARVPRDYGRLLRDAWRMVRARRQHARALLKDPIAFFSAPWIARRFDASVVVMTRHPAAFASSLKRLDWTFDFENWLSQKDLMKDVLQPWEPQIREFALRPPDILSQAALIWTVLAGVTLEYQERFPDWIFLRHEDLSVSPLDGFKELFDRLGLEFTSEVAAYLRATSSSDNPVEAPEGQADALRRNSRENIKSWKKRLSPREIDQVRDGVREICDEFYDDSDW